MGIDLGRFRQDLADKALEDKLDETESPAEKFKRQKQATGRVSMPTTEEQARPEVPVQAKKPARKPRKPRNLPKYRIRLPKWRPYLQKLLTLASFHIKVKKFTVRIPGTATLTVVAVVLIGGFILLLAPSVQSAKENKTAKLYANLMSDLSATIKKVQASLSSDVMTMSEADLSAYHGQMVRLDYDCYAISNKNNVATTDPKAVKDSARSAQSLCHDLIPVADYSKAVYENAHDLLLIDASAAALDPAKLSDAAATINTTQTAIKSLSFPSISDPAQSEMTTVLDRAGKAAADLKPVLEQGKTGSQQATTFITQLQSAQQEITNARPYYWNNTIQINALSQATQRLQTAFQKELKQ
jgi:hypothetical protein